MNYAVHTVVVDAGPEEKFVKSILNMGACLKMAEVQGLVVR